jgi:hypothetical protein
VKRVLPALVLCVALLVGANAQAATKVRRYEGTTSDGSSIGFKILRAADRELGLRGIWFDYVLTCPSGRSLRPATFGMEDGDALGYPMDGHHLDFLFFDGVPDVRLYGVFRARSASGTISLSRLRYTADGDPVVCTSGPLDWRAHRA